jgi:hypothetical protein
MGNGDEAVDENPGGGVEPGRAKEEAPKKRGRKGKEDPADASEGAAEFNFGANVKPDEPAAPAEPAKADEQPALDPADLSVPAGETGSLAGGPDRFDPEDLRVSGGAGDGIEVKKMQLVIPVTKPRASVFVRTHPTFIVEAGCLEIKGEKMGNELYLLAPAVKNSELKLDPCYKVFLLRAAITRQGDLFVWYHGLPKNEGRQDSWYESAKECMEKAETQWVRVSANMDVGGYDAFPAEGKLPEPVWPDMPWGDILMRAFKGRYINALDHPRVKKLRGEV